MKTMKKVLAIVFAVLMIGGMMAAFSSCGSESEAVINIYMPYVVNFDPATAYADEASAKVLPLLYEGLTVVDSKGKLKGSLADEWEIYTDRDGQKAIDITLKTTRWSDGQMVDAEDFLDAWERILDPEFNCEAAPLLFPIKNAVDVKNGNKTVSDLGIRVATQKSFTVILEDWADPEQFLRNCASVALYPIRKDVINKVYDKEADEEKDWSSVVAIMQTNGPFFIKSISFGSTKEGAIKRPFMILERNTHYYLDPEKNEAADEYVTPFRIQINMTYGFLNDKMLSNFVDAEYNEFLKTTEGKTYVNKEVDRIFATMTDEEKAEIGNDTAVKNKLKEQVVAAKKADLAKEKSFKFTDSLLEAVRENKEFFFEAYKNGSTLFNAALPSNRDDRSEEDNELLEDIETVESMTTGAFYFNTNHEILSNVKVRQALSLALDREAIASLAKCGSAASTLITNGVFETTRKTSFKENSASYALSTSANVDEAKSLLASAGVKGGKFTITVRNTETDIAIARYAAEAWNALGFDVSIRALGYEIVSYKERQYTTDKDGNKGWTMEEIYDTLLHDNFNDAYNNADFDVIFHDVNMLTTDAFVALAPFAGIYSSRAYDITDYENIDKLVYGVTGYYNKAYDDLMSQAFKETDAAKRAELLHKAEALLLTDMPITPVIHFETTYLESGELGDVEYTYFGAPDFKETSYDNYVPVVEEEEAGEEEEVEEETPEATE